MRRLKAPAPFVFISALIMAFVGYFYNEINTFMFTHKFLCAALTAFITLAFFYSIETFVYRFKRNQRAYIQSCVDDMAEEMEVIKEYIRAGAGQKEKAPDFTKMFDKVLGAINKMSGEENEIDAQQQYLEKIGELEMQLATRDEMYRNALRETDERNNTIVELSQSIELRNDALRYIQEMANDEKMFSPLMAIKKYLDDNKNLFKK